MEIWGPAFKFLPFTERAAVLRLHGLQDIISVHLAFSEAPNSLTFHLILFSFESIWLKEE